MLNQGGGVEWAKHLPGVETDVSSPCSLLFGVRFSLLTTVKALANWTHKLDGPSG